MPPSWIATGCLAGRDLAGRDLVQRRDRGGEKKYFFFPSPSPLTHFLHLTPTPSANISSPQSSRVTESKMAAEYENVHSRAPNTPALQASCIDTGLAVGGTSPYSLYKRWQTNQQQCQEKSSEACDT